MNKADFVSQLATKAGLSKADAARATDSFIETITEALKRGEEVTFTGFGGFKTVKREARQGRNPRTGQPIEIAASIQPKFSAGKLLREAVND